MKARGFVLAFTGEDPPTFGQLASTLDAGRAHDIYEAEFVIQELPEKDESADELLTALRERARQ